MTEVRVCRACYPGRAGSGSAGRAVPPLAYAPSCPPLAAGREAWTWTLPSLRAASPGRGHTPQSHQLGLRTVTRSRRSRTGSGSVWDPERCQTLDAMSRRKLGSRPQHLSAIQGKPGGRAAVADGCDVIEVKRKQKSKSLLLILFFSFLLGLSAVLRAWCVDARWHRLSHIKWWTFPPSSSHRLKTIFVFRPIWSQSWYLFPCAA